MNTEHENPRHENPRHENLGHESLELAQTQFLTLEQIWDLSESELHNLHKRLHEKVYWNLVHPGDTCDDPEELQTLVAKVEGVIERKAHFRANS